MEWWTSTLSDRPERDGEYVLYWLQAAQRIRMNPAYNHAVREANARGIPLVVCFRLHDSVPHATARHYSFMLEGIVELAEELTAMGVPFVLLTDREPEALARRAALAVVDRGYLCWQKKWRIQVAARFPCSLVAVDTETVIPVDVLSQKEEYSAATLRPKYHSLVRRYIPAKTPITPKPAVPATSPGLKISNMGLTTSQQWEKLLSTTRSKAGGAMASGASGGEKAAWTCLRKFMRERLHLYAEKANDPVVDCGSGLSPYLHFGIISPLAITEQVLRFCSNDSWPPPIRRDASAAKSASAARDPLLDSRDAFLEEVLIRRELAINFVERNPEYDRYACIPAWARSSLEKHAADSRQYHYSESRLKHAETHDRYWNAAQKQMLLTGRMHNYMRMYWGKKVIEWTKNPEDAFDLLVRLNDTYELDGRDANGYAGIAWCFGKHDRPWGEREIFGTVRYMNETGLRKKFDIDKYVQRYGDLG